MNNRLRRGLPAAALLIASPFALAQSAGPSPAAAPLSAESFRSPGRSAGVHAWWHWLDGAITREGITRDLEGFRAQGVVQATILNVGLFGGRDFGVPRVPFASPSWFSMYRWALAEASRLGITIGVHNCDGWSSSGGPWITPGQSMKQLVWTKTLLGGGAVDLTLPRPVAIEGLYRDVAVVAYRTTQQPSAYRSAGPRLQRNGVEEDPGTLVDGCPISALRIERGDRLVLSARAPLAFDRVAVHLRRPFMWGDPKAFTTRLALETSNDGRAYAAVRELALTGLNQTQVLEVPRSSAPFVRLTVREMSRVDAWIPVELGELELLNAGESPAYAPSIPFVGEKTSAVKAASDDAVYEAGPDARPAVAASDVVVLTDRMDAEGRLRWQAPAGSWAVLRFGYTSTGARNGPATREGTGLEADKMDPAAVEHHFRSFPEKLIAEAGELAGKTLRFVLVDSWEAGFQNWTDRFAAEFEKRRGYSLLPWLPALTGETLGSARESEAVLFDFRRTIADLIRESYYERLAALLHERGVELHAEVIYGGGGYPPLDVLRSTKPVDLPMFEFWTSTDDNRLLKYETGAAGAGDVGSLAYNLPAAAAAGYGKPLLGSEAYTGYAHYSESPAELKAFGDRAFAAGINRMILHSSVHQPTDEKPGMTLGPFASHFNRNNLYWNHASSWLAYQARIQSVLGQGAAVFDVLYFLGDQLPQSFVRNASTTLPTGYTVDAVNAELLAERVAVVDGRLRLNGADAALLSLPPQPYLSLDSLKRIEALVAGGAHVYGPRPLHTLSLEDSRQAAAFRALAERVWGDVDGVRVFSRAYGKGSVSWGRPIAQLLAERHVPPQLAAGPGHERDFLFAHRRVGDADVFFVANQWDRALSRELSFRVGPRTPEVWDPETGDVARPAAFRSEGDQLKLPVQFAPYQALLFVFRPGLPSRFVTSVARGRTTLFPATGTPAEVPRLVFEEDGLAVVPETSGPLALQTSDGRTLSGSFVAPEALPVAGLRGTLELRGPAAPAKPIEIAALRSLTEYEQPEIRYFSGEATYRLRFSVPDWKAAAGDLLRLDLGGFESVAEVTLNGQPLGTLWRPGSALDVTRSLRRDNELVVTVANVYRNRAIGDLTQHGELKNLHTSSPISDFLSPKKPLKPSGLMGPIQVTRIRRQRVPGLSSSAGPSAGAQPATSAKAGDRFALPASDAGLPGAGPIRRYDWFRQLWRERRTAFAKRAAQERGAVVFLGDSITQGWGDDLGGAFPGVKVANRGISGDTTRGVLLRLEEDVLALDPKAVVLLIGTNDLEEGATPELIAGNLKLILAALERHDPRMPIVLCQVFPSAAAKKRPAAQIQALNALYLAAVKNDPRVTYLETWPLFAGADGDALAAEFPDLLHPNEQGYAKWAAALRPVLATLGFVETAADPFVPEDGFELLFNGRDLTGWGYRPTSEEDKANARRWQASDPNAAAWPFVEAPVRFDGETATPDGRFAAIHGRLVVKAPPEYRKIQQLWTSREFPQDFVLRLEFRATPNADSGVYLRGPQLQCRDYRLAGPYKELKGYKPQDWNQLEVTVRGGVARATCNGELLEAALALPASGPVGVEGDRGQMEYRRIRISTTPR